jgi:hypothetical protein
MSISSKGGALGKGHSHATPVESQCSLLHQARCPPETGRIVAAGEIEATGRASATTTMSEAGAPKGASERTRLSNVGMDGDE